MLVDSNRRKPVDPIFSLLPKEYYTDGHINLMIHLKCKIQQNFIIIGK